jgi:hypothetical protein
MHYAASTHVHLFCIPTYVSWCELNAHPAWLMPSHVRQNVLRFLIRFRYIVKRWMPPSHVHLMPIKCASHALNASHLWQGVFSWHKLFILHSDVCFMMRIECASNTVNAFTRTSKRLRFPLFTWKYLHFLYMQKIITVVTYANWKLLVIGVKHLEHAGSITSKLP